MAAKPLDIEAIYLAQGRELWAILYARCCDADLALEALQEAFLRLHQHRCQPIENPGAWLLRVGQNWLHDVRRQNQRRKQSAAELDETIGPLPDPCTFMMDRESHASIREIFAALPEAERQLLIRKYALGWDSKRIAAEEQTTSGAIDMRLFRARRRFAEALKTAGVV